MSLLSELSLEILRCQACDLHSTRTKAVPGEGPEDAALFFIGEAPGWNEDQQGRPFVGPAGQFLVELLTSINLQRSEVYITNIVKSRPPSNRDPLPTEIKACEQWLDRQLELIKPKIIVTLGRYSLAKFIPDESIGKVHGLARKRDNTVIFPMYHPAAALHQQSLRSTIEDDFKKLPQLLSQIDQIEELKPPPKQMSMF